MRQGLRMLLIKVKKFMRILGAMPNIYFLSAQKEAFADSSFVRVEGPGEVLSKVFTEKSLVGDSP